MRKGFIVRDRSLSSFPSKQLSVNQFMQQKSIALQTFRSKQFEQSKLLSEKQQDIIKLKVNLDHALKMAVNEAVQNSRSREQSMRSTQTKLHIQKKYMQIAQQLNEEKANKMRIEQNALQLQYSLNKQKQEKRKLVQKNEMLNKQLEKAKKQILKIPILQQKISQIEPLKSRIKGLELSIREQKIKYHQISENRKQLQKIIQQLRQKIKQAKPYQEELQQRIALLERVNLQLERRMEDFHRREHEYKKQVQHYKTNLSKMTVDRNKYKSDYQSTFSTLQKQLAHVADLQSTLSHKSKLIQQLQVKLEEKTKQCNQFQKRLEQTINYYKSVAEQIVVVKKRNQVLQQNQQQMRRVLASHLKVSQQTNLYIISRNSQILKLEDQKKGLVENLDALQKRFIKLDRLFDEESARGTNQIKQSYYSTLKQRNKLALEIKETKQELSQKILKFGQQRDVYNRKISSYQAPIPKQQLLYEAVIADKIQMILTLQSSNDQLLKIKKQQEERIRHLELEVDSQKKQVYNLRLKAAELFKTKKDLEDAKSKIERYQQMIEQQKEQINDLNSQLDVLRAKNTQVSQKMYTMSMENKNLTFKIVQFENVMKELDIEYLNAKKSQNQKNAHVLIDSTEKIQNGINSLAYYFSCCFCGEMLSSPITLAICGHNYCTKCKDAYAEYCYQCDTGQPIERVYSSKFLKQATGKYKFLVMVMKQAQNNLIKILSPT